MAAENDTNHAEDQADELERMDLLLALKAMYRLALAAPPGLRPEDVYGPGAYSIPGGARIVREALREAFTALPTGGPAPAWLAESALGDEFAEGLGGQPLPAGIREPEEWRA